MRRATVCATRLTLSVSVCYRRVSPILLMNALIVYVKRGIIKTLPRVLETGGAYTAYHLLRMARPGKNWTLLLVLCDTCCNFDLTCWALPDRIALIAEVFEELHSE